MTSKVNGDGQFNPITPPFSFLLAPRNSTSTFPKSEESDASVYIKCRAEAAGTMNVKSVVATVYYTLKCMYVYHSQLHKKCHTRRN